LTHEVALFVRPARSGIYRQAVGSRDGARNAGHVAAPGRRPESSSASARSVPSPSATPYGIHVFITAPIDAAPPFTGRSLRTAMNPRAMTPPRSAPYIAPVRRSPSPRIAPTAIKYLPSPALSPPIA